MMPAAKHGDPQTGVDIHLCTVPPSPSPVPLPTPHISVVFDPFDYVPFLGATVTVCGMKRATAGTNATVIHIPPGFPFAPKLPDKDDEIFMGSSTVVADGDPFSFTAVPTLSCQMAGMPSPPRLKKKGPPKAMLLPLTVNLAIPTNVIVGGPPTISLMGMAFRAGFAALGRFAKSGLFKKMRKSLADKLGLKKPGFLRCKVFRAEPVNILNGSVDVEQQDFSLPGRLPIDWVRTYRSDNGHTGLCGPGWETLADTRLTIGVEDGRVLIHGPDFGLLSFDRLPIAEGDEAAELELMDGSLLVDHGSEYRVTTKDDRSYHFPKALDCTDAQGRQGWPIGRISDRCGNYLDFEYRSGLLVAINESAGRRLALTIENDRLTAVTLIDPTARKEHTFVRYTYDTEGDLVAAIDALNAPYCFAYDDHRLVRHTDRNGLCFYYAYEKSAQDEWRVVHAWGDGGLYDYTFQYLDELNERRITDSLSHTSTVKLNEAGLPISEIDPLGGMTIFEYDEAGRTTAVVDQDQHRTEYHYDEHGNLTQLVRPDGNSIETEFDASDKAVKITDANGATWQQEWDPRGLLVHQTTPLAAGSTYQYDTYGQLATFTNPRHARTSLAFDSYGNLTHLTDALGHTTTFAYDMLGLVVGKTDPLGQHTTYGYDAKGRLLRADLPGGAAIDCAYDPEDNLTRYVDENGAETRLEYCGLGEIKRRLQPDGHSVEYHYDTEERLIGVTNQRDERYQLVRDPLGRIIEEIDYWGQSRRYTYSIAGHLQQSIDPLDRIIQYKTDPLGRITQKRLPNPFDADQVQTETFEYDPNGNLTACENATIRIQRTFDAEGRLTEERLGETATITNTYDANGNRLTRSFDLNIGKRHYTNTIAYEYDLLDQSIGVTAAGHTPIQFQRNALGQVTSERLSKHIQRDLTYSPEGYLTAQRVRTKEGPQFEQTYQYDPAGNLTEKRDSALGIDQFTYDPLGRLVAHIDPQGRLKNYMNDPAGDRLQTRTTQQTPDRDGHMDWRREGVYEGTCYRFDRAGNLVLRKWAETETLLRWDANQRLVESATNDKRTRYQYDPLGRRVSKTTGSDTTHFFWDGDALLGDLIDDKNEESGLAHSQLREWAYYPRTFETLYMLRNYDLPESELYLYHNDPNGCPTRMLDGAGVVVWEARYSGWGHIHKLNVYKVENPIRFQGQYFDEETGFAYNYYRYFSEATGDFISQDPIRLSAGINLYRFAPNPLTWIDPIGTKCYELPSFSKVTIDWPHIRPRHMPGGQLIEGRTIFSGMTEHGVTSAIRRAWPNMKKVSTQGERLLIEGIDKKTGLRIQGWYNKATRVLETAYPV